MPEVSLPSRLCKLVAVKKPHVYSRTYGIEKPRTSDRIQTGKKLIFSSRDPRTSFPLAIQCFRKPQKRTIRHHSLGLWKLQVPSLPLRKL